MGAVAAPADRPWFVYLIECADGSIYTGIAVDVAARYAKHASGKGARYTRSRPPVRLLGTFAYADRSSASKAEHAIRKLDPRAKRALCGDKSKSLGISAERSAPSARSSRVSPGRART